MVVVCYWFFCLFVLVFFNIYFILLLFFLILKSLILTCVPKHEPPSHLLPHNISLGHPHAPAPSMLYPASDIDWQFNSYMIVYMLECHFLCICRLCGRRLEATSLLSIKENTSLPGKIVHHLTCLQKMHQRSRLEGKD